MQIVLRMTTFSIYQHLTQVSRHPYMVRPIIQYKTEKKKLFQQNTEQCVAVFNEMFTKVWKYMQIASTVHAHPGNNDSKSKKGT